MFNKKLRRLGDISRKTWDALAEDDAMFYILTAEGKKGGSWDLNEFLETGRNQWQQFKNFLCHYGLERVYLSKGTALELGCGTGRLVLAMCPDFKRVIGVDVSQRMIEQANISKRLLKINKVEFQANNGVDLANISAQSVDFCFSYLTLQHCPSKQQVLHYIGEFSRVLKPNGVALFQFRVAPSLFIYLKFIVSKTKTKLLGKLFKRKGENYASLDAFAGNWVPLSEAYREISKHFQAYYLIQTPVELYEDRLWELSSEIERWKRSFWLCIKGQ